jgi:hypothetical protein
MATPTVEFADEKINFGGHHKTSSQTMMIIESNLGSQENTQCSTDALISMKDSKVKIRSSKTALLSPAMLYDHKEEDPDDKPDQSSSGEDGAILKIKRVKR